jgi:hypothetical protein
MRLAARKPPPAGLLEVGGWVDGHLVESFVPRRGSAELLCEAVGPDGDPVTLVMAWSRAPDRHAVPRFRRFARIRATLHHEALLTVRSMGVHRGRPYLAMERYPQHTFEDLLQGAPLSAQQVLVLLAPVCDALDMAHSNGLVHQSLSGTSILMEGDTALLDGFGVAGGPHELTFEAIGVLDDRYCPPEELRAEPLAPASNVYSLTALLVHALTGHPPFEGAPAGQAFGHLIEPPRRPSERLPQLGTAFDHVVARGLAKEPEERPASAGELLREAAAALGVDLPTRVVAAEAEVPARRRRPLAVRVRRHLSGRALAAAVVIVAAGAGIAAGVLLDPSDGSPASAARPNPDVRVLQRLDDQRTSLRARLAASETPQQQAATAAVLAGVYHRAAEAAESPRIASAVRSAERAYEALEATAAAGSAEGFAAAADDVERADANLSAILQDERK